MQPYEKGIKQPSLRHLGWGKKNVKIPLMGKEECKDISSST